MLLCGAGLMLRSFMALYAVPPGFDVNGLTRMRMQLPPVEVTRRRTRAGASSSSCCRGVEAIPGIQSAAITTSRSAARPTKNGASIIERQPHVDDERRPLRVDGVGHRDYFDTLGVGVERGRSSHRQRRPGRRRRTS